MEIWNEYFIKLLNMIHKNSFKILDTRQKLEISLKITQIYLHKQSARHHQNFFFFIRIKNTTEFINIIESTGFKYSTGKIDERKVSSGKNLSR